MIHCRDWPNYPDLSLPCCRCDNELYGCSVVVKLDILTIHLRDCEHNPKKPVPCSQGCGLTVPKDEMVRASNNIQECKVTSLVKVEHNCVRELRLLVRDQGETICKVQQDMTDMRFEIDPQSHHLLT